MLVSKRRDGHAARRFFQRALAAVKVRPSEVVTDKALTNADRHAAEAPAQNQWPNFRPIQGMISMSNIINRRASNTSL